MAKAPIRNGVKMGRGFKLVDGKVKKSPRHLDVSAQIRQRRSKKTKVVKRGLK
jgi:hypothetical protein